MKQTTLLLGVGLLLAGCEYSTPKQDLTNDERISPKFSVVFNRVIAPKCISCHQGAKAPHGIDLSTYDKIVLSGLTPPLVVPGKPKESSLLTVMETGDMPPRGPALFAEEVLVVEKWIEAGALRDDGTGPPPPDFGGGGSTLEGGEPCDSSSKEHGEPGYVACDPDEE